MFTPRGSPCFVFLRRRVHHHGSLVFALVLRLFARLACRPHDHGSRSTASASWRAPWWGRDRGFRHGYGCSVGAQPLAFRQRCWGSPRGHDGGGSEWYVANCARSWWIVVFPGGLEHSAAHRVLRSPPSPPPVLQFCRRMGIAMSPADALSREARALPELGRGGAQEGHDGLCRAVVATFVRRPRQATPCCWESKGGVVLSSTGRNGQMGP